MSTPVVEHREERSGLPRWLAILLVSMAGLLLEVAYTRVISYKLWYYYTYLVIGLSLLGIGTGGVIVAIWKPIRRTSTAKVIGIASLVSAAVIPLGYVVIAKLRIDSIRIWDYGTAASFKNLAVLGLICFLIFGAFIAFGVIVSVMLGRAGSSVGRLYFADLIGAGIGCVLAIPLIARIGPPEVIAVAALIFFVVGMVSLPRLGTPAIVGACVLGILLGGFVIGSDRMPDVFTEDSKLGGPGATYSEWGPVFRVDVAEVFGDPNGNSALLLHDGTYGSGLHRFDGDLSKLSAYDADPRAIPFRVLGKPPGRELIIGSAGGNEILASLYFGAPKIEAVELNPVTTKLLRGRYADFTGHIATEPAVDMHTGDGRTYLARSDRKYDLVWYVAPDSYAANNAASSGAFVLSESYLYTAEMIESTLEHLSDDGLMVVQFGELDFEAGPNRTARYVMTARKALENIGVQDPSKHIAVTTFLTDDQGDLSTVVLKRTPFTAAETAAFRKASTTLPHSTPVHVPGDAPSATAPGAGGVLVSKLASVDAATAARVADAYPRDISPVIDDKPFFWHFTRFGTVLGNITDPIRFSDPEISIGERVLVLLLLMSILYAAVFLLLPFVAVRKEWRALPHKGLSAIYFAALGLGFMIFEITMIQRLVRFLGYPTYSLTVTLASVLVFAGLGSLLSGRLVARERIVVPCLVAGLAVLTLFYQFGLDGLLDSFQSSALGVRVVVALVVLAPLGLALGMFMPLGLGVVARLSRHPEEYVAWSWAVNGFFSVIGSVLTTMLSMTFGFRTVQNLAVLVYVVAALAFTRLVRRGEAPVDLDEAPVGELASASVSVAS